MRKAILSLLLIITMILTVSVATARDFSATGTINEAGGWTTTGEWQNDPDGDDAGSWTDELSATASHPVDTGASGEFDLSVSFRFGHASNTVKIGLMTAGGVEKAIEYRDGAFWFDGKKLTTNVGEPTTRHIARIYSTDGAVWHAAIFGNEAEVSVGAVPAKITLALSCANPTYKSPLINWVSFVSPGEPAAPPASAPAAGVSEADAKRLQDFYTNVYPMFGSPYDTVSYNADGTYTITKGYPTRAKTTAYSVTGSVTSTADGSPIEGASVVLGDKQQKTDSAGKFGFENVASGTTDIAVSADGFASKTQSVNVSADLTLDFALDKVATGGSTVADAANETNNATMPSNATATPTGAPTTAPSPTQTKSPGFEGIAAAIAMIGTAGVLVYMNRKR